MNPPRDAGVTSLTVLDSHITRCEICGDWAFSARYCTHCAEHGYPYLEWTAEA